MPDTNRLPEWFTRFMESGDLNESFSGPSAQNAGLINQGDFVKYNDKVWYVHGYPNGRDVRVIGPRGEIRHALLIDMTKIDAPVFNVGDPVRYTPDYCRGRRALSGEAPYREQRGTVDGMRAGGTRVRVKWRDSEKIDDMLAHYIEVVPQHTPRPKDEVTFFTFGSASHAKLSRKGRLVTLLLNGHKLKFVVVREGPAYHLLFHWASGSRVGYKVRMKQGNARMSLRVAAQTHLNNYMLAFERSAENMRQRLEQFPVINKEAEA